jgi:hypothetical protein
MQVIFALKKGLWRRQRDGRTSHAAAILERMPLLSGVQFGSR